MIGFLGAHLFDLVWVAVWIVFFLFLVLLDGTPASGTSPIGRVGDVPPRPTPRPDQVGPHGDADE